MYYKHKHFLSITSRLFLAKFSREFLIRKAFRCCHHAVMTASKCLSEHETKQKSMEKVGFVWV